MPNPEKYTPLFGHAQAYAAWDRLDAALTACDNQIDHDAVDYIRGCIRCAMRTKDGKARISASTRAAMYNWLAGQIEGVHHMKAMLTSTGQLLIRDGGTPLAQRPVTTDNPRALVDAVNARLKGVKVNGNDALAWRIRRTIAENAISEALTAATAR